MQSCPVNQFVDVRMEDLLYFKNLTSIDLSDNKISLEWLRNLENIEEIDLQYNSLTSIKDI
jgi:Leucine-rich repeat (LRR) protein